MNKAQIKCLIVFALFAIIGFGPISPGCLIGMYVVTYRPNWFLQLTNELYENKPSKKPYDQVSELQSKQVRKKCFFSILTLFILDIAPIPVMPIVAFIIILVRPIWFLRMIMGIYKVEPNIEAVS